MPIFCLPYGTYQSRLVPSTLAVRVALGYAALAIAVNAGAALGFTIRPLVVATQVPFLVVAALGGRVGEFTAGIGGGLVQAMALWYVIHRSRVQNTTSRERRTKTCRTAVVLAPAAALNYMAWLGWDQHQDVRPDGGLSGPYEDWQGTGFIFGLAVLAVCAGLRDRPWLGSAAIVTTLAACFSADEFIGPHRKAFDPTMITLEMYFYFAVTAAAAWITVALKKATTDPTGP